ncbi:MAG: molybdenum cofactor biosynthesis protein MoaE [Phycisphaerales bacterium]|nr:molybdenum cofactor biosynthesis protein MoaE [Phycisphaerales bacterium]
MATIIQTTLSSTPVAPEGFQLLPQAGAEVVFLGMTRCEIHPSHGVLQHLDYEVHTSMAPLAMKELATEATLRWQLLAIRIQHAKGIVRIGEASVCIEVLASHRGDAFEACRWLIDTLKRRVPIWKREVWMDSTTWVDGTPVESAS